MPGPTTKENKTIVLLSGGVDSTACLHFCLDNGHQAEPFFVDYGQAAARQEKEAASVIAERFHLPIRMLRVLGAAEKGQGLIHGRNAFLVMCALMETPYTPGIIALGIHKGTHYWDCSPGIVEVMQSVLDAYTNGQVQLSAPFLEWTKREIWAYCNAYKVPVGLTYSCELGAKQPCGKCLSCRDLEVPDASR